MAPRAVKENMTTPEAKLTAGALVGDVGRPGSELASPPAPSNKLPISTKTKNQSIRVTPAVVGAARKDGDQLLRDLRTSLSGQTEAEAQERERATGPNEVARGPLPFLVYVVRKRGRDGDEQTCHRKVSPTFLEGVLNRLGDSLFVERERANSKPNVRAPAKIGADFDFGTLRISRILRFVLLHLKRAMLLGAAIFLSTAISVFPYMANGCKLRVPRKRQTGGAPCSQEVCSRELCSQEKHIWRCSASSPLWTLPWSRLELLALRLSDWRLTPGNPMILCWR